MSGVDELDVMCRTRSFCCASRVDSCEGEIDGCEGKESSIVEVDLEAATEDGRVSGSNSAFNILLSLAESVVFGVEMAIFNIAVMQIADRRYWPWFVDVRRVICKTFVNVRCLGQTQS